MERFVSRKKTVFCIETVQLLQDFLERLDQEQQSNRQSIKKMEKMKRDNDKLQVSNISK